MTETLLDGAGLHAVRAYYDQTWLDYRVPWMNPANRAIHFGYWDEHTHSHAESLVNMNRAMAARVQLRDGEYILDAGCGVGVTAMWLAEEYRARVVGITPVATQVARAALCTGTRLGATGASRAGGLSPHQFP